MFAKVNTIGLISKERGASLLESATSYNDITPHRDDQSLELFDLYVPELWEQDLTLTVLAPARIVEIQGVKPEPLDYLNRLEVTLYEFRIESL